MKRIASSAYYYIFAMLLLILPFGNALPNIAIALLIICYAINFKNTDYKRLKHYSVYIYYAFLAYFFIRGAFTQSLFTEWNIHKKFIILLLMPLLFIKVRRVAVIKAGAIAGIMATIAVTLFLSARYYLQFGGLPFGNGDVVNTLIPMERPYAGFYAVAGAIFSFSLITQYKRCKWLLIVCGIVSVAFIILISARISFLTLIVLGIVYLLFYLSVSPIKKFIIIAVGLGVVVAVFMFNKNIAERFFIKENIKESLAVASDYEPRLVIWPCAYELANRDDFNVLFGYENNTTIVNNYLECYTQKIDNESKKDYFTASKFNSHNQFIDFYLSEGLIGFLLFFAFCVSLLYTIRRSFPDTALLLSLIFFLLVENVLHRQTGCYIFSIFAALLLMRNTKD